jgi:hypothetical protein
MRCRALLLAAAAIATVGTAPAPATAEDFPVRARLAGGPATYRTGDEPRGFRIRLDNTTRSARADVHPVIVLVDRDRALTPGNISLEYRDPADATWRPVPLDRTDNDENIGVVGGVDGPGLELAARQGATVELRLGFGRGTRPGHVTASATVMQREGRHGTDGEWVGESAPYEFDIVRPRTPPRAPSAPPRTHPRTPGPTPPRTPAPSAPPARASTPSLTPSSLTPSSLTPSFPAPPSAPSEARATPAPPGAGAEPPLTAPALAATGVTRGRAALAAAALITAGGALVMAARRRD